MGVRRRPSPRIQETTQSGAYVRRCPCSRLDCLIFAVLRPNARAGGCKPPWALGCGQLRAAVVRPMLQWLSPLPAESGIAPGSSGRVTWCRAACWGFTLGLLANLCCMELQTPQPFRLLHSPSDRTGSSSKPTTYSQLTSYLPPSCFTPSTLMAPPLEVAGVAEALNILAPVPDAAVLAFAVGPTLLQPFHNESAVGRFQPTPLAGPITCSGSSGALGPPLVQAPRPTRTERPPSSNRTAFALCVCATARRALMVAAPMQCRHAANTTDNQPHETG